MRIMRFLSLCCLIVAFIAHTPSPARAADATVSVCDLTSFTTAMSIVNTGTGGTITFDCSTVTPITFSSEFTIANPTSVTINANGNTVIFDETGDDNRFFVVNPGASLTLNGFTLQNGNAPSNVGGAISNGGTLTISNSTFTGNSADIGGGAISNGGTLTISNSIFTGNSADIGGGAIDNFAGTLTITDSTFTSNRAGEGGAIYNSGTNIIDGIVTITNSTFTDNSAGLDGGAIYNDDRVTINNSTFTYNLATIEGGAIYNDDRVTINNSTFTGNSAGFGGSINNKNTATSTDSHYEDTGCAGTITGTGNTRVNASSCPGTDPIALDVSVVTCVGDDAVFTINTGDANFDITGTGVGLPITDSPARLITLTGPDTWTNIIVTERRGERQTLPLGGITCPVGVIIPPSTAPTVTVLGCALDSTDGVEVANAPDNTYCRVLMKNSGVVSYSGAVPRDLIGLGVILAVDVYRLQGGATQNTFPDYARVCLAGSGRLFYMDGRNAPRVSIELAGERVDNLTCGWIPAPGTLILTN